MDRLVLVIVLQILSLGSLCSGKKISESGYGGNNDPSFDDLEDLFRNEDSKPFYDAIKKRIGKQEINLEEVLPKMFNEVKNGTVPDELKNFSLVSNYTTNYTYSNSNIGTANSIHYGFFESQGTSGIYTSAIFNFIQGSVGGTDYHAGTCLYSTVKYSVKEASLGWEGSTGGAFLFRMPSGMYIPYGSYAGSTRAMAYVNKSMKEVVATFAIMNTTNYFSKTITNLNGQFLWDAGTFDIDMTSITGGTNATLSGYIRRLDDVGLISTSNGTLSNSDKEATLNTASKGYAEIDKEDPLGKTNLHNIFESMYATVGLYLP